MLVAASPTAGDNVYFIYNQVDGIDMRTDIRLHGSVTSVPRDKSCIHLRIESEFCHACSRWHAYEGSNPSMRLPTAINASRSEETRAYFAFLLRPQAPISIVAACDDAQAAVVNKIIPDNEDANADLDAFMQDFDDDEVDEEALAVTRQQISDEIASRAPLDTYIDGPPGSFLVQQIKNFRMFGQGKPPFCTALVWRRLSENTRRAHRRIIAMIINMPANYNRLPVGEALVDFILRRAQQSGWKWSSISTTLSTAASAIKDLALYTNAAAGFDLRQDNYYRQALQKAQQLARKTSLDPMRATPLSHDNMRAIALTLSGRPAWHLLMLSWFFAGRVHDVRQVQPSEIRFDTEPDTTRNDIGVRMRFTSGKGAAFWGPYTIHSRIPLDIAKPIIEHLSEKQSKEQSFSKADQDEISSAI
jgi:hypothetical protein